MKFFWLGGLILLLAGIPITIYFATRQQNVQTKAAATTTLTITPSATTTETNKNFDVDIMVNPQQNLVSFVKLSINFDSTKLQVAQVTPNTTSFRDVLKGPIINSGSVTLEVGTGSDTTRALSQTTKVTTITFKALAATTQPAQISFDLTNTQVLSVAGSDQSGENVLASTSPASVTITGEAINPTPSLTPTSAASTSAAPSNPVCSDLSASPASSGVAPFSVALNGRGNDPDGTITKANFNFGDTQTQILTTGLNQQSATVSIAHTYTTVGIYSATLTFTDNSNATSIPCKLSINVTQSVGGPASTESATPVPVISAPGDFSTTVGILGGVILLIGTGIFLLAI